MRFSEEMPQWIDADGFLGRQPNPPIREEGNPLLENGIAAVFLVTFDQLSVEERWKWVGWYERAVRSLEPPFKQGVYFKKPHTEDELTRDDLIGVVAGSRALGCKFHEDVAAYGEKNGWVFTPTGKFYYSAIAKPWDVAFYKMADDKTPSPWEFLTLLVVIFWDALFTGDASGKRLVWLMIVTLAPMNIFVRLLGNFWKWRLGKTWGSMQRVFTVYNGERHLFARYCGE